MTTNPPMHPLTETIVLTPPPSLEFIRADGVSFIVPPVTRARLDAADAAAPEPEHELALAEDAARRQAVLAALIGETVIAVTPGDTGLARREAPAAELLDGLTPAEEQRIIAAIMAQASGQDPAAIVAIHELLRLQFILATHPEAAQAVAGTPEAAPE